MHATLPADTFCSLSHVMGEGRGGGGERYLDGLSFNNLGSALPLLTRGHHQIGRFHSAPAPHFTSLASVPIQAALQLVCLSAVEASVTPSDYVDTAAADCRRRRHLPTSYHLHLYNTDFNGIVFSILAWFSPFQHGFLHVSIPIQLEHCALPKLQSISCPLQIHLLCKSCIQAP